MKKLLLFLALGVCLQVSAQIDDTLCNPNFEGSPDTWVSFPLSGAEGTSEISIEETYEGDYAAKITVTNDANDFIFRGCPKGMISGQTYKVSFWARSLNDTLSAQVTSSLTETPFTDFGSLAFTVSPVWEQYTYYATADQDYEEKVLLFKLRLKDAGVYFVDDITVETARGFGVVCNGSFEAGFSDFITNENGGSATFSVVTGGAQEGTFSASVDVTDAQGGIPQLSTCKTDMDSTKYYWVSFWVKGATDGLAFQASSSLSIAPYTVFGSIEGSTTTEWTRYEFLASSVDFVDGEARLLKIKFQNEGTYYTDHVAIEEVEPFASVCNNGFEADFADWASNANFPAEASFSISNDAVEGTQAAQIQVDASGTLGDVQLVSCASTIDSGAFYTVKFMAKSSIPASLKVSSELNEQPYTNFGNITTDLSTVWVEYCFSFQSPATVTSKVNLAKFQFLDSAIYHIDGVELIEGDECNPLSVEEIAVPTVGFFPNPVESVIQLTDFGKYTSISIYDITGRVVKTISPSGKMDLASLPEGNYIMIATQTDGQRVSQKFRKL